jgi:hypothetical protein
MTDSPQPSASAPSTARQARLVGALMGCPEGRRLLEDARAKGINLGGDRNPTGQPTPLHLSSTAVFMIQDVHALCQQVDPAAARAEHFDRATDIANQLVETANRYIHAEPLASMPQSRPAIRPQPRPSFLREFTR